VYSMPVSWEGAPSETAIPKWVCGKKLTAVANPILNAVSHLRAATGVHCPKR